MKLLLLNQTWFVSDLIALGHEVLSVGFHPHFDVQLTDIVVDIHLLLGRLKPVFEPDV